MITLNGFWILNYLLISGQEIRKCWAPVVFDGAFSDPKLFTFVGFALIEFVCDHILLLGWCLLSWIVWSIVSSDVYVVWIQYLGLLTLNELCELLHPILDEFTSGTLSILIIAHVLLANQAALVLHELLVLQLPVVAARLLLLVDWIRDLIIAWILIELV